MTDIRTAIATLTADELMQYTTRLAEGVRISGSPDEAKVFDYIEAFMRGLGYDVKRYAAETLIGFPRSAWVEVPSEDLRFEAIGYSLSPGTSGAEGELVHVGEGRAADYRNRDLRGRIALSDGMGSSVKAQAVDRSGAVAHVNIDDEYGHELCISPVWGSPAPDDLGRLSRTPSVGVRAGDGARLRDLARAGARVRVVSDMVKEWRPIPLLTAEIGGTVEDSFVLFSGHVDSWYHGAMDNATANAVQLGVARVLAEHRASLRRGVRFAFWSGHSHGRYAGSTWYADEHWQDLHDHCACHVNIDSVGAVGAHLRSEVQTMAETFGFTAEVLRAFADSDLVYRRISRAGDQSFWGMGVPSTFMLLSEHLITDPGAVAPVSAAVAGRKGANPWFWHTKDDTLDKIDPPNLLHDGQIYGAAMWRLCTDPVLPLDYAATAAEIVDTLRDYDAKLVGRFDLSATIAKAEELRAAIGRWQAADIAPAERNRGLMALGRVLVPVAYTRNGPFYQDPATGAAPLPGIAAGLDLANSCPGSDEAHALRVMLARERNRVGAALSTALRVVSR